MSQAVSTDPALEREYNVRLLRDDFDRIIAGWGARSSGVRYRLDCDLDLEYGPGDRDRLDLYHADKHGPVLVYIHGGYWQRGDKSLYGFLAERFVAGGVNVAVVNYDLCPNGTIPGILDQLRRALLWLWRNAERLGISPDRLNVCGHSAGGHLTAMLLAEDWTGVHPELPVDLVKSGIPISGLYDLEPLRHTSINDAVGLDASTARQYSPVFHEPATASPVLVCVGELETNGFHGQTERFLTHWRNYAAPIEHLVVPGTDHLGIVARLGEESSEFRQTVASWLR